jgi:hypothetical protein
MRRATTRRGSVSTLPVSRRAAKPAGSLKRLQRIAQALVLDRQRVALLRSRQHHALDQKGQHSLFETASLTVFVLELGDDLQVGRLGVSRDQFQMDRRPCWRRAVLASPVVSSACPDWIKSANAYGYSARDPVGASRGA